MPTREEIDRLKEFVRNLGDEPRVLAESSEEATSSAPVGVDSPEELPRLGKRDTGEAKTLFNSYLSDSIENEGMTSAVPGEGKAVESTGSIDSGAIVDTQATGMPSEDDQFLSKVGREDETEEIYSNEASFDDEASASFADSEFLPEDEGGFNELGRPTDVELVSDSSNDGLTAEPEHFDDQEQLEVSDDMKPAANEIENLIGDSDSALSTDSDSGEELILDGETSSDNQASSETPENDTVQEYGFNGDEPEYSLDDFGDDHDFPSEDDEGGVTAAMLAASEQTEMESMDAQDESRLFPLKEEHYTAIQQTLSKLPRNLKLAIEETLADERIASQVLQPLIDALIREASPRLLVNSLWRITKRRIVLPRGYEKLSGKLLAQKRSSLTYRLVKEGWSIVRLILLVISITWMLGAAAFMWIYRPLMAARIYNMGLEAISADDVDSAISHFYDAWYGWPLFTREGMDRIADSQIVVKGWKNKRKLLEYVTAFQARKYWNASERFYEGYLEFKPDDKNVRLKYADYLSAVMGKHEKAIAVLEEAPSTGRRNWDREYTLAAGDIYLSWAQDDPTKYEEARFRYAKILETSRNDERAYLSMMNYHLRLSDEKGIAHLTPVFEKEVPGETDAPELAAVVYAGLAEYFLARGNNKDSKRFIELARAADPLAPEPTFISAMYWRLAEDEGLEYQAYKSTLANLDARESLSRSDLRMRILTLGGVGRIQTARGEPQAAMVSYAKALKLFEDARARNQLGASPEYGRLYLEQGKIMYQGFDSSDDLTLSLAENQVPLVEGDSRYVELAQAERYFNKAEKIFNSGTGAALPPDILYRRSYIRYVLGLGGALSDFHRVARDKPADYEARLALATALLANGDFETSGSQYVKALELLDDESREFEDVLNPAEQRRHAELLIRYVLVWNNLGVSRARSASRGGDDSDYAEALSAFTMASIYMDEVDNSMHALNARGLTGVRGAEQERIVSVEDGHSLLFDKATYPYVNRLRLLGIDAPEASGTDYLFYPDIPSSLQS